ncbi:hypothetical protein [Streptomyces sp. x-19]|uniref:hypothetical protein n=1 Tax=Streptomyces sp. x-19 TaxID=2789280 RepID=UPI00397FB0E1
MDLGIAVVLGGLAHDHGQDIGRQGLGLGGAGAGERAPVGRLWWSGRQVARVPRNVPRVHVKDVGTNPEVIVTVMRRAVELMAQFPAANIIIGEGREVTQSVSRLFLGQFRSVS